MAHNVPCPSCGTELTLSVAHTNAVDWNTLAPSESWHRLGFDPVVPVASDDLANAEWIDPKSTPEFALDPRNGETTIAVAPRHLKVEDVVIETTRPMVLDPHNAETPLSWADESPPANAPEHTRRYLLEVTATYEGTEPISSDRDFAFFVWMQLHGSSEHPSGITMVEPWIRVALDASEPTELMRYPSHGQVYVRNTTGPIGAASVEVCGVPSQVESFIADNWSSEEADQVIANYKAGL